MSHRIAACGKTPIHLMTKSEVFCMSSKGDTREGLFSFLIHPYIEKWQKMMIMMMIVNAAIDYVHVLSTLQT